MREQLLRRIVQLIDDGRALDQYRTDKYYVADQAHAAAQGWLVSAANAIKQISPPGSVYYTEIDRVMNTPELKVGVPLTVLRRVVGLLESVRAEARAGLLERFEYQIFATAFDDFLDHATSFHKSGKAQESAILFAAVLEDTVKRIAAKNGVPHAGVTLEPLIDSLAKAGVLTTVKAKRLKSYVAVRNAAAHADWSGFDLKDVGQAIQGVRELIDEHLT